MSKYVFSKSAILNLNFGIWRIGKRVRQNKGRKDNFKAMLEVGNYEATRSAMLADALEGSKKLFT